MTALDICRSWTTTIRSTTAAAIAAAAAAAAAITTTTITTTAAAASTMGVLFLVRFLALLLSVVLMNRIGRSTKADVIMVSSLA